MAQTNTFVYNVDVKLGAYLAGNHWFRRVRGFKTEKEDLGGSMVEN